MTLRYNDNMTEKLNLSLLKLKGNRMKKRKKWTAFTALLTIFFLVAYKDFVCIASEKRQFDINDSEVVFVLDTSSSMNKQDADRLAIDAVRQAVYSLPSNYQVGLIAYNTNIQLMIPFGEDMTQWDTLLTEMPYSGYTNTGEASKQAVEMFSEQDGINRYIIMLTDGEIDMPDSQEKDYSRHQYEEAIQEAKAKGIKIYIIAMDSEQSENEMHIFDGAEMTNGAIYWEGQSESISKIMERILYNELNFPRSSVGISEGTKGRINVDLPASGAEYVKIILSAEQKLTNITVDYTAENSMVVNGQKFTVIDVLKPSGKSIAISYESTDVSGIEAYMVMGFTAEIKTQVTYRSEHDIADVEELPAYKHFADIEIKLTDTKGQNDNLWNSAYYEGREVPFSVNGVDVVGNIHNGCIMYSMQIDDVDEAVLELDVSGLSECFKMQQPVVITFSPPEDDSLLELEQKTDYRPLWIILGMLILALAVLFIIWIKKNRKTVIYMAPSQASGNVEKKKEIKNCVYTGKLNLYVLQTPSGEDVPPSTYRLFGRQSVQISLSQILNSCGIQLGKIGAEDIKLYPGPDKALIITDQSEKCTVLRGTEILKKGMGYPVHYNGKLTIVLEDGITEVEVYYKSLKPSEQQNI